MKPNLVSDGIYQLSVNVEDILFEGMWDIPRGVSVNSYIVKGDKTAIIDGVCGWDGVPETLIELLEQMEINPEDIDYVVINHMEPDHSGWLENFKKIRPDFKIICTKKAEHLLNMFYKQVDNIQVVKEGDTLDLGNGRILSFHETPNAHWPEAMMTLDEKSKTLFSCDIFGTFGKITDSFFDENLTEEDFAVLEEEGLRYYSNVMATFSPQVKKAVHKAQGLAVNAIAPGHGLVWKNDPEHMIRRYLRYAEYNIGHGRKEVTIIWGSMYGMTERVVHIVEEALKNRGVKVNSHKVPETGWGQILTSAYSSTGLIIAMPTYEYHMFPPVAAAMEELGRKKISQRHVFSFGSFGWSGGAQKEFKEIVERYKLKWDIIEPIEFNGNAREDHIGKILEGVDTLIQLVLKDGKDE